MLRSWPQPASMECTLCSSAPRPLQAPFVVCPLGGLAARWDCRWSRRRIGGREGRAGYIMNGQANQPTSNPRKCKSKAQAQKLLSPMLACQAKPRPCQLAHAGHGPCPPCRSECLKSLPLLAVARPPHPPGTHGLQSHRARALP